MTGITLLRRAEVATGFARSADAVMATRARPADQIMIKACGHPGDGTVTIVTLSTRTNMRAGLTRGSLAIMAGTTTSTD